MIINKDKSGKVSFRLTKEDFVFSWFSGSGGGGQNRNKHQNCLRLTHQASEVTGTGQTGRDRPHNQKIAFESITNSPKFKFWCEQKLKELEDGASLEEKIDEEMKKSENFECQIKDVNGIWIKAKPEDFLNG